MSDTTARVLQLLAFLQGRALWSGAELAERLGVTTRSVRRDIDRLRELGYPVRASSGVGGGYQLGSGGKLPPLLLDESEAVAVTVSLQLAAGAAVHEVEENALRALAKLDQVLPDRLRGEVSALNEAVVRVGGQAESLSAVDARLLTQLARACRDRVLVDFGYAARSGQPSSRRVEPHRLVAMGRRWYLMAYDTSREDWRSFRLDRIGAGSVHATTFTFALRPSRPDPVEYVRTSVISAPYRYVATLRVHAPAADVAGQVPTNAGTVTDLGDGTCELVTGAETLQYLASELVRLGEAVEVLDPPELAAHLNLVAERLRQAT